MEDQAHPQPLPLNPALQSLMAKAGYSSWAALSRASGISLKQLRRVRQSTVADLKIHTISQLAQALQMSPTALCAELLGSPPVPERDAESFHREGLDRLESWLRYWPIAVSKVEAQAEIKPINLVKLVKPIEEWVSSWGVEVIAPVGAQVPYNPQWHQLTQGAATPGTLVTVVAPGYRYRQKLWFRAEVEPSPP